MGSGGVAIAALFIVICLEVPFSDGLGGWDAEVGQLNRLERSAYSNKY